MVQKIKTLKKSEFPERRNFFSQSKKKKKKKCIFRNIATDFENRLQHQVNIILCAFLYFNLLVHNLLSNVSPFCNRKFPSISHTSGFGAKNLSSKYTTFVRVILFSEMLPIECLELCALVHYGSSSAWIELITVPFFARATA